jgi:hypothetical protein
MTEDRRRRNTVIVLLLLLLLIALLLVRCRCAEPEAAPVVPAPAAASTPIPQPGVAAPAAEEQAEVLTPATLESPAEVTAGAALTVRWTGPDNPGDYIVLVRAEAASGTNGPYRTTKEGPSLELTAPVEPGAYELRYETGRSHTVLGRKPLTVLEAGATIDAVVEVVLGSSVSIAWTGPDNTGDYLTIVPKEAQDGTFGNYTTTDKGSPLSVTAPTTTGEAEIRYMTGQGRKVLARRALRILAADASLSAPDQAVAGATIQVAWTGPNNAGDYVTVVLPGAAEGDYGDYKDTRIGSPLALLMPVLVGEVELRYVVGQGHKVLARRTLRLVAAEVTLAGPDEAAAGSAVSLTWTGPNYSGDYLTIVPAEAPDGQYAKYQNTSAGSPLTVSAPDKPGACEIRYMTGQGDKVLARRPIRITP